MDNPRNHKTYCLWSFVYDARIPVLCGRARRRAIAMLLPGDSEYERRSSAILSVVLVAEHGVGRYVDVKVAEIARAR